MYSAMAPLSVAVEAVDVVWCAHPVLPSQAEPAPPAGHDLLGDHPVTDIDTPALPALIVDGDDLADEFVARDDFGSRGGGPDPVAPVLDRAVVALEVTGADPDGLDLARGLRPGQGRGWVPARGGSRRGPWTTTACIVSVIACSVRLRVLTRRGSGFIGARGRHVGVAVPRGGGVAVLRRPVAVDAVVDDDSASGVSGREQGAFVLHRCGAPVQRGPQLLERGRRWPRGIRPAWRRPPRRC